MLYEVVLYPVVKGKAESEMKLYGHVQTISDTRASKLFSGKLQESINESHSVMSNSLRPCGLYSPWNFPGQNTGVESPSLLQGIFPTQGLNPSLLHYRWILYQLSHKGRQKPFVILPLQNLSRENFKSHCLLQLSGHRVILTCQEFYKWL